jgi:hypothetical protein
MMLLLVASLVFSWMRATTGSVFPSIFARMTYVATSAVPMVVSREIPKPTKGWITATIVTSVLGLVGIARLSRDSAARQLDASFGSAD